MNNTIKFDCKKERKDFEYPILHLNAYFDSKK